jgi:hypothetical protein
MSGRLVAVEGPSAAGKTRVIREAAGRFDTLSLPEAYDRLRPRPSLRWRSPGELLRLEQRLLREEARRYLEARRLVRMGATVLADTGFLGPLTYTRGLVRHGEAPPHVLTELTRTARELAAGGRWGLPEAYLYLRTPAGERRRRARQDLRGHPAGLQALHQEVAREELAFYRAVVVPRFGPRFRFVSGVGVPATVVDAVGRALRRLPTTRVRPPSLGPVLDAVEDLGGVS